MTACPHVYRFLSVSAFQLLKMQIIQNNKRSIHLSDIKTIKPYKNPHMGGMASLKTDQCHFLSNIHIFYKFVWHELHRNDADWCCAHKSNKYMQKTSRTSSMLHKPLVRDGDFIEWRSTLSTCRMSSFFHVTASQKRRAFDFPFSFMTVSYRPYSYIKSIGPILLI